MKKRYLSLSVLLGMMICGGTVYAQNTQQVQKIQEVTQVTVLEQISITAEQEAKQEMQQALSVIKERGMQRVYETPEYYMELQGLDAAGEPMYYITSNVAAAKSIGTNRVHNGGGLGLNLEGQGMVVGEWDGGPALSTHQEFDYDGIKSRVTLKDSRNSKAQNHGTHVACTMIGSGTDAKAKGMAPKAKLVSYDWNSDKSEMAKAAANGLLLSNHSYGISAGWVLRNWGWSWYGTEKISKVKDWKFGYYDRGAKDFDKIAYNAPKYLICKAAGNDRGDGPKDDAELEGHERDGGRYGYDCISSTALAKNVLTVGAAMDVANYTGPSSVEMTSFSSWGPCDDGRIKPDVCGNGYQLYSAVAKDDMDEISTKTYKSYSGTSMATPNVTGSLLLLQQHYNKLYKEFMFASCLKALVIHTASECGPNDGPDYMFGWGLVNIPKAASCITGKGKNTLIEYNTLKDGEEYSKVVKASGNQPLVVTVVWADMYGEPLYRGLDQRDIMLVNDLNVVVEKKGSSSEKYYPWKLDYKHPSNKATRGVNNVDNVEKIEIPNPTAGEYIIKVTHKGKLVDNKQAFGMVVTGFGKGGVIDNPIVAPSGLKEEAITKTSAVLKWNKVESANSYELKYRKEGSYSWTTQKSYSTNVSLSSLIENTKYEWKVKSIKGSKSSDFSAVRTFKTKGAGVTPTPIPDDYCVAKGRNAKSEWISGVKVGSFENTSGSTGYSDFTSKEITLKQGSSYAMTLTPGYKSTAFGESFVVYLDMNGDGDFTDNGETIYSSLNKKNAVSGNFTLPSSAKEGTTRMRVTMKFGSNGASSCGEFSYGEVEDYTVVIKKAGVTPTPTPGDYCAAKGKNFKSEWISEVKIGSFSNTSTGDGYAYYSSKALDLNQGSSYDLKLTSGYKGTAYGESWSVWVDLNGDGDFSDNGEQVFSVSNKKNSVTGNFTLPSTAKEGATRMRIAMKYGSYGASPCGEFSYGEVEDYLVNISGDSGDDPTPDDPTPDDPTSNSPKNLKVKDITKNTAMLHWDAVSGADYYTVKYRKGSSSSWKTTVTTRNKKYLYDLWADTNYDWKVKAETYSNGDFTSYSVVKSFKTLGYGDNSKPVSKEYCVAKSKSFASEWIASVGLGSFSNASAGSTYSDFTNKTINMNPGKSYDLYLKPGFSNSAYGEAWKVWIDLNRDGDFDDAGEEVYASKGASRTSVSGSIKLPLGTSTGLTRMRVSMKFASHASSCGTFSYGEVEDYTVNISNDTDVNNIVNSGSLSYCDVASTSSSFEWISKVELGSFSNVSQSSKYSDFTSQTVVLSKGVATSIKLTSSYAGTAYPEGWTVFIDLNGDGDFSDNGEKVFTQGGQKYSATGVITVPAAAKVGATRMRVMMHYMTPVSDACESFNYGEVEDYTVSILDGNSDSSVSTRSVASVFIPEFLSPNNDGSNDTWDITGLEMNNQVVIYNKAGQIVYNKSNYMMDSERFTGAALANGAYLYTVKQEGKEDLKGTLYLNK